MWQQARLCFPTSTQGRVPCSRWFRGVCIYEWLHWLCVSWWRTAGTSPDPHVSYTDKYSIITDWHSFLPSSSFKWAVAYCHTGKLKSNVFVLWSWVRWLPRLAKVGRHTFPCEWVIATGAVDLTSKEIGKREMCW